MWTTGKSYANVLGMTPSSKEFGDNLEAARKKAAKKNSTLTSYRQIERLAIAALGPSAPSNTAIANLHHGLVSPERASIEVVCFLAGLYGVRLRDLSPVVAERYDKASDLIASASPWITANPSDLLVCAVSAA